MMRMVNIGILILVAGLSACGKNPFLSDPPIAKFNELNRQIQALSTPESVEVWLNLYATYDLAYNKNWGVYDASYPDQAYALAASLWNEKHGGKHRGVCGQFAAFFILAARTHGYKCGGLITRFYNNPVAHAWAWIEMNDGTIMLTDNRSIYTNNKRFRGMDDLIDFAEKCEYFKITGDDFSTILYSSEVIK